MIKRVIFSIELNETNQNFDETIEKIKHFLNKRDGITTWNCFTEEFE